MPPPTPKPNRLARSLAPIEGLPAAVRVAARSFMVGRVVKFVGTAGLRIEELTTERAVVVVPNRTRVQNHIGGVHAAAMALVAETATGFVLGMNLPDDKLPLIKWMRVDYKRRAEGGLRADLLDDGGRGENAGGGGEQMATTDHGWSSR